MARKNVELVTKKETYYDEKTKQQVEYDSFYVCINGMELKVKPGDKTCKQLLLSYLTVK